MRSAALPILLIALTAFSACRRLSDNTQPPEKWTTGFWFWGGSSASVTAAVNPIDVIFCQVGSIRKEQIREAREPWKVYGNLLERLPPAREYWLVFRFDDQSVPALEAVPQLTRVVSELQEDGRRRVLQIAGIQLDIDSPTRTLPEYASFLRQLRKSLPAGTQVSITALLDWFRDGTGISEVLKEVDEFVPQFYDVQDGYRGRTAIANKFNGAKWGPIFNRHKKRFRIGISTFGRSRLIQKQGAPQAGYGVVMVTGDLKPLDVAVNPAFRLQTSSTHAGELVLSYWAMRSTTIGYTDFEAGDAIEFILSTPEAIRAATEEVRHIQGYCAGVVFFRWPSFNETLATHPDEVLTAAGVLTQRGEKSAELRTTDGNCAAVSCVDLYLLNTSPFWSKAMHYRIKSSSELEYFVPDEGMPTRMSSSSFIELTLPPHGGQSRIYLGRAVSRNRGKFTIEEGQ